MDGPPRATPGPGRCRAWAGVGVGLVLSLTCTAGLPPAGAARAASGTIRWVCASEGTVGPSGIDVALDTGLLGVVHVGEPADVAVSLASALPAGTAKQAHDAPAIEARSVEATITLQSTVGAQPFQHSFALPSTPLPDQSVAAAVPFTIVSGPAPYVPSAAGDETVVATSLEVRWTFRRSDGSVGASIGSTCGPSTGQPLLVDSLVVRSRSTTSLVLDAPASVFGETPRATATVSTTVGVVGGGVAFSIDGVAFKEPVDATAVASLTLPLAPAGTHRIAATFLADDPAHHDASTSVVQTWTVAKARAKARVTLEKKRSRRGARVAITMAGVHDTIPSGKVRLIFKRATAPRTTRRLSLRLDRGRAMARVGGLRRGRYVASVSYQGDANHLPSRRTARFRVR